MVSRVDAALGRQDLPAMADCARTMAQFRWVGGWVWVGEGEGLRSDECCLAGLKLQQHMVVPCSKTRPHLACQCSSPPSRRRLLPAPAPQPW